MSDITLSPIPYNGGTLSMTNANSHICYLTDTLFFAVFAQAAPAYVFAATYSVDNIRASSPVVSVIKQRVIGTTALTRVRLWKLSATRVLALLNADLKVFEVQPNGDVVVKAATLPTFHSTYIWGTETTGSGIGTLLYGHSIKTDSVWFVQRATTTSAAAFFKVEYNSVSDTLTKTSIVNLLPSTTATHFFRPYITKIQGSNNYLVYGLGGNTTHATSTISAYYVCNDSGVIQSQVTTGIPTTVKGLVPLAGNTVLGIVDQKTFQFFDGTTWNTSATYAPTTGQGACLGYVRGLDSNHFITMAHTSDISYGTFGLRISKFINKDFGSTNALTSGATALSYTFAGLYFDQEFVKNIDSLETFVFVLRSTTTSFTIKVLCQP